jgi:hypothetical protein
MTQPTTPCPGDPFVEPCGVAAVSRDGSVIAVSDAGQDSIIFLATSARGRSRRAETVAVNYMTGERFEPPMSEDLRE